MSLEWFPPSRQTDKQMADSKLTAQTRCFKWITRAASLVPGILYVELHKEDHLHQQPFVGTLLSHEAQQQVGSDLEASSISDGVAGPKQRKLKPRSDPTGRTAYLILSSSAFWTCWSRYRTWRMASRSNSLRAFRSTSWAISSPFSLIQVGRASLHGPSARALQMSGGGQPQPALLKELPLLFHWRLFCLWLFFPF